VGHQADQYILGRIPVRIASDSVELLGPVGHVLRPCPEGGTGDSFNLHLQYGSEPSGWKDESLRLFWSGPLRGGIACESYAAAGCRVARVPGRAWGRLDFERRTMQIVCHPGHEGCVYDGCLTPLLVELLAHLGQFVIHAASLAIDRPGGRAGVLLAGASGTGKTTTSLALAHSGMTLLADDMSFVESPDPNGDRVRLWGLLLTCKVHDNTRMLLPWLHACPAGPARVDGETCVDVVGTLGDAAGITADPRLLLLLGPRTQGDHVFLPLNKTQAMATLTRENVRAYEHRADGSAGNAFRALGRLVAQCRAYRLCVGRSLSTLPERIRSLLDDPT